MNTVIILLRMFYTLSGTLPQPGLFRHNRHFNNFLDFFLYVKEEEKDLELFSMLVWTVWYRRNLIRTQSPKSSHQLPRHCRTLS